VAKPQLCGVADAAGKPGRSIEATAFILPPILPTLP
jgi:hypothetical protein